MPEQQEVVIVGADGKEHVFPPGFDPKRAAAIVRGQSELGAMKPGASAALKLAAGDPSGVVEGVKSTGLSFSDMLGILESIPGVPGVVGKVGRAAQGAGQVVADNPVETAEVFGGTLGSIPGLMRGNASLASGGAMAGTGAARAVGNVVQGKPWHENVVRDSAASGAMELAGLPVTRMARKMGDKLLLWALGPNYGEIGHMVEAGQMTRKEVSNLLIKTMKDRNINVTDEGVETILQRLRELHSGNLDEVGAMTAAGETFSARDTLRSASKTLLKDPATGRPLPRSNVGSDPSANVEAIKGTLRELATDPVSPMTETVKRTRTVTPPTVTGDAPSVPRDITTTVTRPSKEVPADKFYQQLSALYDELKKSYGPAGTPRHDMSTATLKTVAGEMSDRLKQNPTLAGSFAEQHELLNLLNVIAQRNFQVSKQPMDMYQTWGLATGNPVAMALGKLRTAPVQGRVGLTLNQTAEGAQAGPTVLRALAALLFGGEQTQETPDGR